MLPWKTLDRRPTPEGPLELRQRGERSFLITIGGRVLMTSEATRSEHALAESALAALQKRSGVSARARVLLGGLGMGFTLRAALDRLPRQAAVTVVDLNQAVVDWCRGPLAPLTGAAVDDRRVTVVVADVASVIGGGAPGTWDAILLDLYEGPHQATNRPADPLYGSWALERTRRALRPDGVFAVWSEEPDAAFDQRLERAGFAVERVRVGRGGRRHVVYLAQPSGRRPISGKPAPGPSRGASPSRRTSR